MSLAIVDDPIGTDGIFFLRITARKFSPFYNRRESKKRNSRMIRDDFAGYPRMYIFFYVLVNSLKRTKLEAVKRRNGAH